VCHIDADGEMVKGEATEGAPAFKAVWRAQAGGALNAREDGMAWHGVARCREWAVTESPTWTHPQVGMAPLTCGPRPFSFIKRFSKLIPKPKFKI
jgi:hypothetical protein